MSGILLISAEFSAFGKGHLLMRRLFGAVNKKLLSVGQEFFWRSGRDSNPRAAFDDNTISSRARYDLFDTTAYSIRCETQQR